MNIKILAVLQTIGIFASAVVATFAIEYLTNNVDTETLKYMFGGAVFGAMAYLVYQLCLTRLQIQDSFKSAIQNLFLKHSSYFSYCPQSF